MERRARARITACPLDSAATRLLAVQGTHADDFLISYDGYSGAMLTDGASCKVNVRFAPTGTGPRSATLAVTAADLLTPPTIALSGTGTQVVQPQIGPAGDVGPAGPTGPRGPAGPTGPAGKAGQVQLVTCQLVTKTIQVKGKPRKVTQRICTTKLVRGPVKSTTSTAQATLSRGKATYATGTATVNNARRQRLSLRLRRPLPAGSYTLTLRSRTGKRLSTTTVTIVHTR